MALFDEHFHAPYHPWGEIQKTCPTINVSKKPLPTPMLLGKLHFTPTSGHVHFPSHKCHSGQTRETLGLQMNPYLVTSLHFQDQFFHEYKAGKINCSNVHKMLSTSLAHSRCSRSVNPFLLPFKVFISLYIYDCLWDQPKFPLRSQLEVLIYLQIKKLHTEKLTSSGLQ